MDIRNDRLKGMSYTEISRKHHIDRRTAKKYAQSPGRLEYTLTEPNAQMKQAGYTPKTWRIWQSGLIGCGKSAKEITTTLAKVN